MALSATVHRVRVALSDVDRNVYESLDLRLARHPSEAMRWLVTRLLAYCLSYEEGIAFSKGGLSSTDEAPVSIHDPTGLLLAWIDIGAPSAERLHRASKAAGRVALFTSADLALLRREASTRAIHQVDAIEVFHLETELLDAIAAKMGRNADLELVRNEDHLYVTIDGATLEGRLGRHSLLSEP